MAMDLETNGLHNGTNGVDHEPSAQAEPTTNGNHKLVDSTADVAPVADMSSGLDGVGDLAGGQHDNNSLFGSDAGITSTLDAVEAPTSDIRDEPLPPVAATTQESTESTQKVPETQLVAADGAIDQAKDTDDAMDAAKTDVDPTPPPTKNMTDLSLETQQAAAANTPAATVDHEMEDAPPSGKVRPREDDDAEEGRDEERDAKRVKTDVDMDVGSNVDTELPAKIEQSTNTASIPAALPTPTPTQEGSVVQTAVGYKEWPSSPMTESQRKFRRRSTRTWPWKVVASCGKK